MSWIDKFKSKSGIGKKIPKPTPSWIECKSCKVQLYEIDLEENANVCPKCDYHFRLSAEERITQLVNPGSFIEHDANLTSGDPLKFKDLKRYKERLKTAQRDNPSKDSIISGTGMIGDHHVELCAFQFKFMGGSMGSVVGEKITRAIERAVRELNALIIINCSGGARMQEGIFSLMQMAKTSAALNLLAEKKLPYISILTDPTTGGVSASFAFLGDIILAEPGATVGFAGKRVIEQTIKQKLPEGFQTAEFLLEHGLIDQVVHRHDLRATLNRLLSLLKNAPCTPLRS
ncbi:MAG: acetyl-CoA carboxylase carboxyltransferase subunit beta [Nitrospina sp.]|nr:acetyl-CoA carboxylase carboxyltransferase subunit beta [Nitrospina sp.]